MKTARDLFVEHGTDGSLVIHVSSVQLFIAYSTSVFCTLVSLVAPPSPSKGTIASGSLSIFR